jgi:hypothetical protein
MLPSPEENRPRYRTSSIFTATPDRIGEMWSRNVKLRYPPNDAQLIKLVIEYSGDMVLAGLSIELPQIDVSLVFFFLFVQDAAAKNVPMEDDE